MKDFIDKILVSFAKLFTKKNKAVAARRRRQSQSLHQALNPKPARRRPTLKKKSVKRRALPKKKIAKPKVSKKLPKKTKRPAKKISSKKSLVKKVKPKKTKIKTKPEPKRVLIGEVTHYFAKIQVIVLKMTAGTLAAGESIYIKGKVTEFSQKVNSMQIESVDVKSARRGQTIGLKVVKEARPGDLVYKA